MNLHFKVLDNVKNLNLLDTVDKKTPHYNLNAIRSLIDSGHVRITIKARRSGLEELGLDKNEIIDTVYNLTGQEFYKSMTPRRPQKMA